MDALLEEYPRKVEGGEEVLAARRRELLPPAETEAARRMREEERPMSLERTGGARVGPGRLYDGFWESCPGPTTPKAR